MAVNLHQLSLPLRNDISGLITTFLELAPGVADTRKNVEWLLAYVVAYRTLNIYDGPSPSKNQESPRIEIRYERRSNRRNRLLFNLTPALRTMEDYVNQGPVFSRRYDATTTGLLHGIADVKSRVVDLKRGCDDPPRSCKRQRMGERCRACALSSMLGCEPGPCRACRSRLV
jgi:hypothetical protein